MTVTAKSALHADRQNQSRGTASAFARFGVVVLRRATRPCSCATLSSGPARSLMLLPQAGRFQGTGKPTTDLLLESHIPCNWATVIRDISRLCIQSLENVIVILCDWPSPICQPWIMLFLYRSVCKNNVDGSSVGPAGHDNHVPIIG